MQAFLSCGDFSGMADFGTGLRAHLEVSRHAAAVPYPAVPVAPRVDARSDERADERRQLEAFAAELAGRELALAQRESELAAEHEQMALALARALVETASRQHVAPPVDELAALRARRYGAA